MANTSDKTRVRVFDGVPMSRAQYINEAIVMTYDSLEIFDDVSRQGEAMEMKCENEKDVPYEAGRAALKAKGKELSVMDSQPIDMVCDSHDGKPVPMCDFVVASHKETSTHLYSHSCRNVYKKATPVFSRRN